MEAGEIIRKVKTEGRAVLTEAESKQLLRHFDVPVVDEVIASSIDEAVSRAEAIGFPVVMKGLGARLTHKTERGLVKLNLKSIDDVRKAADEITEAAGDDLEGFLLYRFVEGRREFMAGLFNDAQFGAVVMFGLGGIFAEAFGDVVLRVAPLNETHAYDMINQIHAVGLLEKFRGEQAVKNEQIIQTLVGLSRLGIEHPEVREVDVNPLLASFDGRITAVDALVILGDMPLKKSARKPIDPEVIRNFFSPRSIAIVGASSTFGKWGYTLFTNIIAGNYKGEIYLVNSKGSEIAGRPVFRSVADIPGPVDLAVVIVPASKVIDLLPQLKAKNIKSVLMVTSGFSETGKKGLRLEERLVEKAREAGITILGPNTMGICNPHEKLFCTYQNVRPRPGSTTLVAQSGNLGTQILAFAESEGIGIRAFIGSGNEAMITIEDYIEIIEFDDLTKTVVLYIESIKDGRRFFEATGRVARKKPVIMLKGGRTRAGNRAAASHTGALASDIKVFEAACRQAGVVLGETSMDLLDLSAAFSSLPLPKGRRIAIMTLGGGWGVITADLCVEHGLEVPELSPNIISRIDQVLPPYWSRSNPVDLVAEMDLSIPIILIEELMKWNGCDAVIHLGILGRQIFVNRMIESSLMVDPTSNRKFFEKIPRRITEFELGYNEHVIRLMEKYGKPILGVCLLSDENTRAIAEIEGSPYKGVSFLTPERAVKALAGMYSYKRWLDLEGIA
ncbi:MAG TPA: acetate--CoA ligase family protein [Syntrophales bacterium]|nr:acetate--CoA ligase family protein [Syntrophales bacterium]